MVFARRGLLISQSTEILAEFSQNQASSIVAIVDAGQSKMDIAGRCAP